MSKPPPLNEEERAELVAYLDGELSGERARAVETRLSLDPSARAEADALKRTWDLLDFLPRPEPSASFTQKTLSRAALKPPAESAGSATKAAPRRRWVRLAFVSSWAAAVLLCAWGGSAGFNALVPRAPGERELVRELRLIENKRFYDAVPDFDFLKKLDQPDLFGEEGR